LDRADLEALREKYEVILALRLHHERARSQPGYVEPDPRKEMSTLARRFPGALREIDVLPLAVVRERIASLSAALEDATAVRDWMVAAAAFHRLARGALAVKRWLAAHRHLEPHAREAAFAAAAPAMHAEARAWADALDALARPPRGRVLDLVYGRLAAELGKDDRTVRELVTPPRERAARRR